MEMQKMKNNFIRFGKLILCDAKDKLGRRELGVYIAFGVLLFLGYHTVSDGLFSCIVTAGSVVQCIGLSLMIVKILATQSTACISMKTFLIYVIIYVLRLSATGFREGYLPVDSSGDWAYQFSDVISLGLVIVILLLGNRFHCEKNERFPVLGVTTSCVILSYFVHPCHNLNSWFDVAWTAALYLECFVMFPQLFLVAGSQEPNVETFTSHFIACTFFYRFANFAFWFHIRDELVTEENPSSIPGYFVVGALGLQLLVLLDFMYYYVKALVYSTNMTLPYSIDV